MAIEDAVCLAECIEQADGDFAAAFRALREARAICAPRGCNSKSRYLWDNFYHVGRHRTRSHARRPGVARAASRTCSTASPGSTTASSCRQATAGAGGMSKHVAVLMGGWSAEREVSLRSGKACADALERAGYRVTRVDVGRDIATVLDTLKPDVALNVLHGRPGEDGTLQGVLEILGIPYTPFRRAWPRRSRCRRTSPRSCCAPPACRCRRAWWCRASRPPRPSAAAALCHQADRRRLERRRLHRHRAARPSAAGTDPRGLGLRRARAGRTLHPRQGADLRGDGRQGARTSSRSCRRRSSTTTRRNTRPAAPSTCCRRRFHRLFTKRSERLALKAHHALGCRGVTPRRLPLRRQCRGDGGTGLSRGQHPTGHDRNLARARARGPRGHVVR